MSTWQSMELAFCCFGMYVVALGIACAVVVVITERHYHRPTKPAGIAPITEMTTYPSRKRMPVVDGGQQLAALEQRIRKELS